MKTGRALLSLLLAMLIAFSLSIVGGTAALAEGWDLAESTIYGITVLNLDNEETTLEEYKGKVLLIVNTATKCGYTSQYEGLEKLYEVYRDQGFEILDFPCNQFLNEAPGDNAEIDNFCKKNYDTQFPRFAKLKVNGKDESPLYTFLKSQKEGKIKWNFTKFLISRDGEVLERFEPGVEPAELEDAIKTALEQSAENALN